MAYLWIFGLILLSIHIVCLFYFKWLARTCTSTKRLDGKTCLVTGGTAGMGLEVALDFARRGARVIVACPFPLEGENAKNKIIEETGNNNVSFEILDLASFKSVRTFAATVINNEDRLDILVNNAGLAVLDEFTDDGLGGVMQVNYFGHFLLTILLLPLLKKTGTPSTPARIVNVASIMHWFAILDLEQLNFRTTNLYTKTTAYSNSKLCLLLFAFELTKRLSGSNVVINSVDPGLVKTNIYDSGDFWVRWTYYWWYFYLVTPREGAQTSLHVALDYDAGTVSGKFFRNCRISPSRSAAYDDATALGLWHKSVACVQLSQEELDKCLK